MAKIKTSITVDEKVDKLITGFSNNTGMHKSFLIESLLIFYFNSSKETQMKILLKENKYNEN